MKSIKLLLTLGLIGFGGCGDSSNNGDGGHPIGDGHIETGCSIDSDCDNGNKCSIPHCNIVTKKCENLDKQCSPMLQCNVSNCDPGSGQCVDSPGHDGDPCTTTTN